MCDTTPINYLIQIGLIDLIPRLYGKAAIPSSVHLELLHPNAPLAVRDWAASLPVWMAVKDAATAVSVPHGIHRGEQDAIALALDLHAQFLLTDDYNARTFAHTQGIDTVTTLLILDAAADRGWITFSESLQLLLATNFRVDTSTFAALVEKHS